VARSSAALTAILLTERSVPSDAPPLSASEFWAVVHRFDLVQVAEQGLSESVPVGRSRTVDRGRVDSLLARSTSVAFELDRLRQSGVTVLSALDDAYPAHLRRRLGDAAPPLLYVAGDTSLFAQGSLAIVGSRGVSPAGADVARGAARLAVADGLAVVSGGASGVDQLAMAAAWEAGGAVVAVLPEGLDRALRARENRAAVLDGRALFCSPYKPTAGFSAGNAMARNKIVYAQSSLALVVASDEGSGGTWAGATEALAKRLAPVAVWMGEGAGAGNAALVERGAMPVDDLDRLLAARDEQVPVGLPEPAATGTQLGLDLPL
jgi:predicted Rossmann fold nucleotide-binding protein DprA/Smf involved in DNA uptake